MMEEEINNSIDNKDYPIQNNIQASFTKYFISLLQELPSFFLKYSSPKNEIKRYLKENTKDKDLLELLPINIINSNDFIQPYSEFINLIHKNPNKIPYFTKFEQNEIQLLYLLQNVFIANGKIELYNKEPEKVDNFTNNHLIKINNIIKSNPDLIGYVYILKWLQKIITLSYEDYNTEENIDKIIKDKKEISGDTSDPIKIEEICQNESKEEYNNLMKQFTFYLFKGNIVACQEICEKRKIEEFSNVFSGGCPLFDKVISTENDFKEFDKDLISPSMYNKDYQEFLDLLSNNNIEEEKNVYGNALYILWMQVMYENADYSKNGSLLNYLFRLVSGNYKNYDLNNNNIYEYLYINILNLLHSKIFSELTRNPKHKMVQYHYIENESFKEISQIINDGGRNIFSIIDAIMENNNYNILCKRHPLLWLELSFIKLFFLKIQIKQNNNFSEEDINKYFQCLQDVLNKMENGNDFIFFDFDEIIDNEREFNYSSINNKKLQTKEFYDMINICLSRAYFSSLVNFYNIENKFFERLFTFNNNYGENIEKIFANFDQVYINYIKNIINLNENGNLDFDVLVYITAFMFDINSIISILTDISHYIGTKEKYQEFIIYIKKFFENIRYNNENLAIYLIRILTNKSNLLSMTFNQKHKFTCIDDALNYFVEKRMNNLKDSNINYGNENNDIDEISDDDKYKINQILCLFDQTEKNKLNQNTSFSYLLKLFIKFLVNYKYIEAYELKTQLNKYIYVLDAVNDDMIYTKIKSIENELEKIKITSDNDIIQSYTILCCKYLFIIILDCFYFYANKIMVLYNTEMNNGLFNNKNKSKAKSKKNIFNGDLGLNAIQFITQKINVLNKFMRKIIENEYFFNYSANYFGEDTKNDFIKLIGDWIFQSIKWSCDIFKMGIIDKNKNDSLSNILNNIIYGKDDLDKYYFENGILSNDIINENDKEKKIFEIMNEIQKQKIVEMMYYMAKINRNYLEETFDEKFFNELNENNNVIIQELEFDEG